jgi:hypothetical protein
MARWLYILKTKDNMINAVNMWYSFIADFCCDKTVVIIRDHSVENKSWGIKEFF